MSNKTQLQTNNATLDGYIARINAAKEVAAGLPEAGGGGGGNVETCTVTITPVGPSIISYVNNGQIVTVRGEGRQTRNLIVTKNTIMFIEQGWSSMSVETGECNKLFYQMASAAYAINGDCTLVGEEDPILKGGLK